ncbi:MAG TPA: beta-propeller fold lactonase family protein [Burkholderiales bacterium]|nr:beta-propeller fold lactonase family protein [Burkholderiales bacterium]
MKPVLYSAVDDEITRYEIDLETATLARRESINVPSFVQYAWPHPSKRWLYVTTSNRGPGLKSDHNHVSAYRIDPQSGALTAHGDAVRLPHRATHMCVDPAGEYTLNAHNVPSPSVSVHRLNADGTIGAPVEQPAGLDWGIYPHQVRMTPSGRTTVVVDRGNSAHDGRPEDPGALRSFAFDAGRLSGKQVVAPNGGYGFGPRHVDFHPTQPWMYVADEKRSQLYLFRMPADRLEPQPAFTRDTLADRANVKPRQLAGTVHVHPNGRTVYVANRADYRVDREGTKVFGGGENSIAVFSIDPVSGEPVPVQHAQTHSYHVRTFALDPSGSMMVAASIKPMDVRDGASVVTVAAALSVFRVGGDGKLEFIRKYDVDTSGGRTQYWMGIVG